MMLVALICVGMIRRACWIISVNFIHTVIRVSDLQFIFLREGQYCCLAIYCYFFFVQFHHMSVVDFVVLPPGHGRSVTDFRGWDAHEARLRCPDGV